MSKLKAIIVDDEPDSVALLQLQIERHCPTVELMASFINPIQALGSIPQLVPDIVFMDVEMPGLNGFELLEQLSPFSFQVIFITAFSQYAIKAFRFNALDYLLKPADINDLQVALNKMGQQRTIPEKGQLNAASQILKGNQAIRLALPSQTGIEFITLTDILYVEASNNYSKIHLTDNASFLLSKTLKDVQELLEGSHFHRIHRQYLVNTHCVKHFNKNDGYIILDSKVELPIVRNQYERFMEKFYRF